MAAVSPVLETAAGAHEHAQEPALAHAWPVLDYLGISLLIMLPLWRPGFILTMDTVFVPHERFLTASQLNMQPIVTAIAVLNLLVPADIIEKFLFTSIFLLAGLGMHRLVDVRLESVRYTAGLAAVFNPFVYDHMMYGQWTILLGYALLPWLLASVLGALTDRTVLPVSRGLRVAAWWTAITVASVPMGLIATVAVVIAFGCFLLLAPRESRRHTILLAGLTGLCFVILNAFWIVPQVFAPSADTVRAVHFGPTELLAFATQADATWGSLLTVLAGYGFWAEGSTRFTDLRGAVPYWPVEALALVTLSLVAIRRSLRGSPRPLHNKFCEGAPAQSDQLWITATLAGSLVVATTLAIGMASPPTASFTRFLFTHNTLYHGLRDTQKWVALVMVTEIALAALGLDRVLTRLDESRRKIRRALSACCLMSPVLFAPALFWGCADQLNPVQYPRSWSAANVLLTRDPTHGMTLFLPWHQYLRFGFTGRVIANPAQSFFDVPVVQGDNMEMRDIASDSVNPTTAAVERIFTRGSHSQIASRLAQLHVKYVLLAKAADWGTYRFLDRVPHMRLVRQWADLFFIRDLAWRG